MKDRQASLKLGFSPSYFSKMKKSNRYMYFYLTLLGKGCRYKGYLKFRDKVFETKNYLIDLYYKDREVLVQAFVKFGSYSSFHSAYCSVDVILFSSGRVSFDVYRHLKRIERYFRNKEKR